MSVKVSVIVPVYNALPYLRRCIDSLLGQSYKNLEIILVDDGSTDGSNDICIEYSKSYQNVVSIRKFNGGVSSARNLGIQHSSGEWIAFCDSDDTMPLNAIETLVAKITDGVDCIVAGYRELDINGEILYTTNEGLNTSLDFKTSLMDLYIPRYFKYNGFLVNRLFRSSIIREFNLRLCENIYYREDGLFITEYLCHSKKNLVYISTPVYNYYMNPSSAMMTLGSKFTDKFLTELDSRILSKNAIRDVISLRHYKLRYKASSYVIEGYDWIISLMDKYSYHDVKQRNALHKKTIESVSAPFYYFYRIYKRVRKLI